MLNLPNGGGSAPGQGAWGGADSPGAALFARQLPRIREHVRPIYVRMGIITEVAAGLESGAEQPPFPGENGSNER